MSIEGELLWKQNLDKLIHEFACKQARKVLLATIWVSNMVGKTDLFRIPEFMIGQTFSFSYCISTLSCDVTECVILRDEHEYYGDTSRHWFLMKRFFQKLCLRAHESLIWHCGAGVKGTV